MYNVSLQKFYDVSEADMKIEIQWDGRLKYAISKSIFRKEN